MLDYIWTSLSSLIEIVLAIGRRTDMCFAGLSPTGKDYERSMIENTTS